MRRFVASRCAWCLIMVWALCGLADVAFANSVGNDSTICAPPALNEVLSDIAPLAARSGLPFHVQAMHSPQQARQIVEGANCDIFISPDSQWTEMLAAKGLLADTGVRPLTAVHLVLVGAASGSLTYDGGAGEDLARALKNGRLAIADPESVSAGRFAKLALQAQGAWSSLAGIVLVSDSVKSLIVELERGVAVAGIVYASDLQGSRRLRLVYDFSENGGPLVRYMLSVIRGHESAQAVANFIAGPEPLDLFLSHGFVLP